MDFSWNSSAKAPAAPVVPVKTTNSTIASSFSWNTPSAPVSPKLADAEAAAQIAKTDADNANSFGGMLKNTVVGIGDIGKTFLQNLWGSYSDFVPKVQNDVIEGSKDFQSASDIAANHANGSFGEGLEDAGKGIFKSAVLPPARFVGAVFAPLSAAISSVMEENGGQKLTDDAGKTIADKSGITDWPAFQTFAMQHPNAGDDFQQLANLVLLGKEGGNEKIEPSTMLDRTKLQIADLSTSIAKKLSLPVVDATAQTATGDSTGFSWDKTSVQPEKSFSDDLHNGSNGEVSTVKKSFDRVISFPEDQQAVIKSLADGGDKNAQELISRAGRDSKVSYTEADTFLRGKYGDDYDAIRYNNAQLPEKGVEYHDLNDGKFYSVKPETAKLYSMQSRGLKYEPHIIVPPTEITAEPVKAPENPDKVSGVAKSIQEKAIEKGLTDSFNDLAGYQSRTVADQAAKVADFITKNPDDMRAIVSGDKALPSDMSASMFIKGVEEHATLNGDVGLIRDIASSPLTSDTSIHAQELRFLAERDQSSAVDAIKDLERTRAKAAEGRDLSREKDATIKEIKDSIKNAAPTKQTWGEFIDSIKC